MDMLENDNFHINCYQCGTEYKTRKSRDDHVKRDHPMKQRLLCPICEDPEPYDDAVGFMKHSEQGRCPRIDPSKLQTAYIHKELIRAILDAKDKDNQSEDSGHDSDSDEGGISLLDADIPAGHLSQYSALPAKNVDLRGAPLVH